MPRTDEEGANQMYAVIRTDRTNDTTLAIIRNLTTQAEAEGFRDMLNGARVHLLPSGHAQFLYRVERQA